MRSARVPTGHAGASRSLLLVGLDGLDGSARNLALAEAGLEPGHAAAGVEDLLLARVERVAGRAHIGANLAAGGGRPGHERAAAAAGHGGGLVRRVNFRLHLAGSLPSSGRRVVARTPSLRRWRLMT